MFTASINTQILCRNLRIAPRLGMKDKGNSPSFSGPNTLWNRIEQVFFIDYPNEFLSEFLW